MTHPILNGSAYKFYALAWSLVMVVHGLILYLNYGFGIEIATVESLIYNLIFAAAAPGFWYLVRFANLGEKGFGSLLGTHFVAGLLSILIWTSLCEFILRLIIREDTAYLTFLEGSNIWRMVIGVMYYSITVLIFYLIKYYLDLQDRLSEEQELKTMLKESELRMLKSQINPHFIFNSLNSISALTISKPKAAREMVIKLSDFLRYSLGKDSVQMNSLEQEIENVTLYLDIEKVRFGNKLKFENKISEDCLKVKVPNLILQPIIENAIKHGVYESIDTVTIELSCMPITDFLRIEIKNNFDRESVSSKGEGIGLENVRKRLALVYGRHDLLEVNQENDEFGVIIKIPLNS